MCEHTPERDSHKHAYTQMNCTLTNSLSLCVSRTHTHTSPCDSAVSYSQLRGNRARSAELKNACQVYFCLRLALAWAMLQLWTELHALICCCPTSPSPLPALLSDGKNNKLKCPCLFCRRRFILWFVLCRPWWNGIQICWLFSVLYTKGQYQ